LQIFSAPHEILMSRILVDEAGRCLITDAGCGSGFKLATRPFWMRSKLLMTIRYWSVGASPAPVTATWLKRRRRGYKGESAFYSQTDADSKFW